LNKEQTLSILKPDAVRRQLEEKINQRFQKNGLRIIASKKMLLTRDQAAQFYAAHKERPFFNDLCDIMSKGEIIVQVLEGEKAISMNRQIMGDTNPENAEPGTIRKDFALSIDENTVHGSDSPEAAETEIAFFFDKTELASPTENTLSSGN
jgi:nucleoside-diphosphate kinase